MLVSVLIIGSLVQSSAVPLQEHAIRYGIQLCQALQNNINTHDLYNLEKAEYPKWEDVGDMQKCPHLQLLLMWKLWKGMAVLATGTSWLWSTLPVEKTRAPDFGVNSFGAGTATSDALQHPGVCLAVCCLIQYQDPELSCKMVGRKAAISGRTDLGHHTVKPVWLPVLSKDRRGRWWNYQVHKILLTDKMGTLFLRGRSSQWSWYQCRVPFP